MTSLRLEHVNLTVTDADRTSRFYEEVFGFHRRWEGAAMDGGRAIHVGTDESYLALYEPAQVGDRGDGRDMTDPGVNHFGFVVEDLDAVDQRLRAQGVVPHTYYDYEPGRRLYFDDLDGFEVEVVAY